MSELLTHFGKTVRSRRLKLGKTIEQLAYECGLSASFVSGIELGKRNPSLETVCRLAYALGAKTSELTRGLEWSASEDS